MTGCENNKQVESLTESEYETVELDEIQTLAKHQTPQQLAKRIENIKQMEILMEKLETNYDSFKALRENLEQAGKALQALKAWYFSPEWLLDYAIDESGAYDGIDRGVLSEDGLYNLFLDYSELGSRLEQAALKLTEPNEEEPEKSEG